MPEDGWIDVFQSRVGVFYPSFLSTLAMIYHPHCLIFSLKMIITGENTKQEKTIDFLIFIVILQKNKILRCCW